MPDDLTCLITIHGIGFQHAPQSGQPGYADGLHDRLQARLPDLLSGDPVSEFGRPAGMGAVYVHSDWPPGSGRTDEGLKRLGRWKAGDSSHRDLDITDVPLAEEGRSIAHVALVYAGLEEREPHLGAVLETMAKAVWGSRKYASIPGLLEMAARDTLAIIEQQRHGTHNVAPGLQVRARSATVTEGIPPEPDPSGPLAVIAQLDQDVSTYVVRNDLRSRVRSFAHEAVLRICSRSDVSRVVINAHSQGTVLAFDTLRELPPFAADQVTLFVTAGSPLRKYVDLFLWGTDAGQISGIPWSNFWDRTDPVADPLEPPPSWRRGDEIPPSTGVSQLYASVDPDTGETLPVHLADSEVANAAHGAGGGLPAHNYWENDEQFVQPLADLLQSAGLSR
jgi:hypothetical protein